jgi:hypothetical protein
MSLDAGSLPFLRIAVTFLFLGGYNVVPVELPEAGRFGPRFAFPMSVRLWERADQKLTGSRWPWERWYSESVGFFLAILTCHLPFPLSYPSIPRSQALAWERPI